MRTQRIGANGWRKSVAPSQRVSATRATSRSHEFPRAEAGTAAKCPSKLLGRIIRASSNEGDVVLDPFAGSGTTLAAAKKLARTPVGFELSAQYFNQAQKRLKSATPGAPLDGVADPLTSAPRTGPNPARRAIRKPVEQPLLFSNDDRQSVSTARGRRRPSDVLG